MWVFYCLKVVLDGVIISDWEKYPCFHRLILGEAESKAVHLKEFTKVYKGKNSEKQK